MTTETDLRSCVGWQAQTNGDLFTQVKLIHYLSTSPLLPLPSRVPLNPSIMVYDCNLNTRQTSDTSQYILFISQRYKLIISLLASGQSVTKLLDYLRYELSEGDFNFDHRLMELNLGCWKKLDKVCKFQ